MGEPATSCLFQGYFATQDFPYSELPVELIIFRNAISDIYWASLQEQYTFKSGKCLRKCEGVEVCTQDISQFYGPIPTDFNATIYGSECALELGQKKEELETSGLLSRIADELAFLECLYSRRMYVYCIHSTKDLRSLIFCF